MTSNFGLDAFNFTLAGAREGFGPFLGVFLQHQGFDPAQTGVAMGIAGLAGVAATIPLGVIIDRITAKRVAVVIAVVAIAIGAALVVATKQIVIVGAGQVLIGVADSSLAPLVAALTLGLVGQANYTTRVSRNEAYNHAGNAANAALAALLGYSLGLGYVALAIVVMAVATSAVMLTLDSRRIDHDAARGGKAGSEPTWRVLVTTKPLLLLAFTVLAFQAANGAMLPFIAQFLTTKGYDPSLTTGFMTVTAQASMIAGSLVVPRLSRRIGNHMVLSLAFVLVVLRAALAAWTGAWWAILVIEIMEGISMGLAGVAVPALVIATMSGTGHAGAGLGSIMMFYGAGAALSPVLAGFIAQTLGFSTAFIALGVVAGVGLVIWIVGQRLIAPSAQSSADAPSAQQSG